jgi:hypothetical protein
MGPEPGSPHSILGFRTWEGFRGFGCCQFYAWAMLVILAIGFWNVHPMLLLVPSIAMLLWLIVMNVRGRMSL